MREQIRHLQSWVSAQSEGYPRAEQLETIAQEDDDFFMLEQGQLLEQKEVPPSTSFDFLSRFAQVQPTLPVLSTSHTLPLPQETIHLHGFDLL